MTPARALSAATVASCVSTYALDPASTSVVTNASLAADGTLGEPSASVDVLVSLADDDARWHAPAILAAAFACVKPGGTFVAASLASPPRTPPPPSSSPGSPMPPPAPPPRASPPPSPQPNPRGPRAPPSASDPANSRRRKTPPPPTRRGKPAAAVPHLLDDDDLLDETEIREGADAAAEAKASGDCSTSATACKNCSCGRAEVEATGKELTAEEKKAFKSACGNCYKGDAFRCAGVRCWDNPRVRRRESPR